jgi:hypothetical protein
MLSIIWFCIALGIIWLCFFNAYKEKELEDPAGWGVALSIGLTFCAWDWIFSHWFHYLWSCMPQDNEILMAVTTCILWLIVVVAFYCLPPYLILPIYKKACIIIKMQKSHKSPLPPSVIK